ncbi:unnamed protein product, partial [Phaeothamnion confervicola]
GRPGGAGRPARVAPRRVERPQTAAEVRAAEVRATRGPRPEKQEVAPPPWERNEWVDDGPIRDVARSATRRASRPEPVEPEPERAPRRVRKPSELAPEIVDDVRQLAAPARVARYQERLTSAAEALERGRFDDAKRMVQPVLRELPDIAYAHEIAGQAWYRLGQWRKAAAELELARQLDGSLQHHAVL